MRASALPESSLRLVKNERPLGAKLQLIAVTDPKWMLDLERLVDWKLAELSRKPTDS